MKLVAHDKFKNPIVMEVTSMMLLDDHDNPVICALWHQSGHIQAAHIFDKDFPLLASMLGFSKKVVVSEFEGQATWQHP